MATTSRIVEWKVPEAQVIEIPIEGVPTGTPPQQCDSTYALVYAGHGKTNSFGSWTTSLPAISCLHPAPAGDRRPSVVATPLNNDATQPFILVAGISGATITIRSFQPGGASAPNVEFSWHCVVEGTLVKQGQTL